MHKINVHTYSYNAFKETGVNDDNVESFSDYYICIHASGYIYSHPIFKKNHYNVLNLWFDDTVKTGLKAIPWNNTYRIIYAKAITVKQAKIIYNFIHRIKNGCDLHIYCPMGESRSIAICNYVTKYINNYDHIIPKWHNKLVFNLLEEVHNARI